jgi:two-component system cell cycle sensor histidine kinase/response regulator CckA
MATVVRAQSKRIALIEDDDDIRGELVSLLRDEGYQVAPYDNGLDAFRALQEGPRPDLIVLDLRLPGMDGWQFRVAQKAERALSDVPVVAMSADGSAKARAIDVECFLAKPLNAGVLLESVRRVLDEATETRSRKGSLAFERMASLGTLAAGMAHEINNPLAYVTANLRLIAEQVPLFLNESQNLGGDADDPCRARLALASNEIDQMIAECLEGAERIRKIVQDVRMFSYLDDAPTTAIDPQSVLGSAINLAKNELRQSARLETRFDAIPLVLADEGRLAQVFLNVLVNAAQAMDPSSDNLVSVTTSTGDAGEAVIAIQDNARGMTKAVQARIFEPFFTTKSVGGGVGLGLSICHGILTSLGGEIRVESEVGKGSTFTIVLPPAPAVSAPVTDSTQLRAAALRRSRILIVDDEPTIARVLARLLGKGHEVVVATSGSEALDVLAKGESFDVILCDLLMPGVAGMDVYDVLAAKDAGIEKRIIFMSGGAFTPRAVDFVGRVPNRFLDKPIDTAALFAAIRGVLDEADRATEG